MQVILIIFKKGSSVSQEQQKTFNCTAQKGTTFVNTYHRFGVLHINLASTNLSTIFRTQLIIFICVNFS